MSHKRPILLDETPYKPLRRLSIEVALLPWGATEAHNTHLPCGTDNMQARMIGREAARIACERGAKVLVLPTIPFGVNTGQFDVPGTINMNPSTQMAVLEDVVTSLEHQRIPKLVVLNGHGGNEFKWMIRELQPKHRIFLSALNWWTIVDARKYFDEPGDHGGEMETSIMMHIAPEQVLPLGEAGEGRERKRKIRAFREGWAWSPRQWSKATHDTGIGNPKAATAEKGRHYFEAVTGKIAEFLVELSAADPKDLYE